MSPVLFSGLDEGHHHRHPCYHPPPVASSATAGIGQSSALVAVVDRPDTLEGFLPAAFSPSLFHRLAYHVRRPDAWAGREEA